MDNTGRKPKELQKPRSTCPHRSRYHLSRPHSFCRGQLSTGLRMELRFEMLGRRMIGPLVFNLWDTFVSSIIRDICFETATYNHLVCDDHLFHASTDAKGFLCGFWQSPVLPVAGICFGIFSGTECGARHVALRGGPLDVLDAHWRLRSKVHSRCRCFVRVRLPHETRAVLLHLVGDHRSREARCRF